MHYMNYTYCINIYICVIMNKGINITETPIAKSKHNWTKVIKILKSIDNILNISKSNNLEVSLLYLIIELKNLIGMLSILVLVALIYKCINI